MGHIDRFFNHEMILLQQQLEALTPAQAHVRSSLLGRRLRDYRASTPLAEGHGLERIGRYGAFLASFEGPGELVILLLVANFEIIALKIYEGSDGSSKHPRENLDGGSGLLVHN